MRLFRGVRRVTTAQPGVLNTGQQDGVSSFFVPLRDASEEAWYQREHEPSRIEVGQKERFCICVVGKDALYDSSISGVRLSGGTSSYATQKIRSGP